MYPFFSPLLSPHPDPPGVKISISEFHVFRMGPQFVNAKLVQRTITSWCMIRKYHQIPIFGLGYDTQHT